MADLERAGPLSIAHRGASAYAPENTRAAFDLAFDLHADALEIDVRFTSDGVLVALHDDDLSRLTNGACRSRIDELSWQEASSLDVGTWFNDTHPRMARSDHQEERILMLDKVFARYRDSFTYLLELKHVGAETGMEREVATLVREHGLSSNVVVATFSQKSLLTLRDIDPVIGRVQLFHTYATSSAIRAYIDALPSYCSGVGPYKEAIDARLVESCGRHGLDVFAWTVNDPHEMDDLIDLGVAGLVTDFPDVFAARLEARHAPPRGSRCSRGVHEVDAVAQGAVASFRA